MKSKKDLSTDEQIEDIISRYDFKQDDDHSKQGKNGDWIRRCVVLTNKKDPHKRRYVVWKLSGGSDEWEVILASSAFPNEEAGVKRKERIYIAAALRFIQEQLLTSRCKAPGGSVVHGQCQRCGGDLIYEMRHDLGTGYVCPFVCFGNRNGCCDFTTIEGDI